MSHVSDSRELWIESKLDRYSSPSASLLLWLCVLTNGNCTSGSIADGQDWQRLSRFYSTKRRAEKRSGLTRLWVNTVLQG